MERKVFRSRISVLLIGLILAIFIPISIPMFNYKIYQGLYILGGTLLFMLLLFCGMRYIISENRLHFKVFWVISFGSVYITDIISVVRSYNMLSSPAASLKRLRINFRKSCKWPFLLISPVREQEFLKILKIHNPNIYIHVNNKRGGWRIWDWDIPFSPDDLQVTDDMQQTDQSEIDAQRSEQSAHPAMRWLRAIIATILMAVAALIYLTYKEPKVQFDSNTFKLKGIYGINIPFAEIAKVDTISWREMPAISIRTNGISLFKVHRGYFKTREGDKIRLNVNRGVKPVIRIVDHRGAVYYINRKDAAETRKIFKKLQKNQSKINN